MAFPNRWKVSTLQEINRFSSRTVDPKTTPSLQYELYSVPTFPSGEPEILMGSQIGSTKQAVEPDDVLICKINPRINRVWVVKEKGALPQIGSSEWIAVRAPDFDPRFLCYYFSSPDFRSLIEEGVSGVGGSLTRAQPKRVSTFPIPVASRAEQSRIADKLQALLIRVDKCQERLQRVPELIESFRETVLEAAVTGRLTEGWRAKYGTSDMLVDLKGLPDVRTSRRGVDDVAETSDDLLNEWVYPRSWGCANAAGLLKKGLFEDVKDGNHGANHPKAADFSPEGIPFITAAQVADFEVDYDGAPRLTGKPLARLKIGFARAGDVILTHKGTVGRVAVANRECVLTPQTTYYRVNSQYVEPRYLMYYMASPVFSKQLSAIKSQTTRDFVPISVQYTLAHLIPPINEQAEIVRRVDALFESANEWQRRQEAAQRLLKRLVPSSLTKAFRGELVPQDLADEPAEKMLEKIRAARDIRAAPSETVRVSSTNRRRGKNLVKPTSGRGRLSMSKNRSDPDVKGKPYLANILRDHGTSSSVEELFKRADLPVADFYKQLAWEVDAGHIKDKKSGLEAT